VLHRLVQWGDRSVPALDWNDVRARDLQRRGRPHLIAHDQRRQRVRVHEHVDTPCRVVAFDQPTGFAPEPTQGFDFRGRDHAAILVDPIRRTNHPDRDKLQRENDWRQRDEARPPQPLDRQDDRDQCASAADLVLVAGEFRRAPHLAIVESAQVTNHQKAEISRSGQRERGAEPITRSGGGAATRASDKDISASSRYDCDRCKEQPILHDDMAHRGDQVGQQREVPLAERPERDGMRREDLDEIDVPAEPDRDARKRDQHNRDQGIAPIAPIGRPADPCR
jgi:hypothetical protein